MKFSLNLKPFFSRSISIITVGLIPCFLALGYLIHSHQNLITLGEDALYLYQKNHTLETRYQKEQALLTQLSHADRDYIQTYLENSKFLFPEIQKLEALRLTEPDQKIHQKRLDFLQNDTNTLHFKEQNFQRLGKLQEVEVLQKHSVEMNRDDLKTLLAKIENIQIGDHHPGKNPPDLLITNFEMTKKPLATHEETFVIQMQLIKRELAP